MPVIAATTRRSAPIRLEHHGRWPAVPLLDQVGGIAIRQETRQTKVASGVPYCRWRTYRDHAGYVAAVRAAADALVKGFCCKTDADALIAQAGEVRDIATNEAHRMSGHRSLPAASVPFARLRYAHASPARQTPGASACCCLFKYKTWAERNCLSAGQSRRRGAQRLSVTRLSACSITRRWLIVSCRPLVRCAVIGYEGTNTPETTDAGRAARRRGLRLIAGMCSMDRFPPEKLAGSGAIQVHRWSWRLHDTRGDVGARHSAWRVSPQRSAASWRSSEIRRRVTSTIRYLHSAGTRRRRLNAQAGNHATRAALDPRDTISRPRSVAAISVSSDNAVSRRALTATTSIRRCAPIFRSPSSLPARLDALGHPVPFPEFAVRRSPGDRVTSSCAT